MGGKIGVESCPGKGSRFYISVPAKSFTEIAESAGREAQRGGQPRITRLAADCRVLALVVDDIQENRDVLAQLLRDVGVTVNTAESGRKAVEAVHATTYDIVFMDIRMPDMDGVTAAREILRLPEGERPRLVAVSASALLQQRQEYLEAGFEDFLAKPISDDRLYAVLARLLQVRFEYGRPEAGLTGFEKISLPDELLNRLRAAADAYNATELMRCLESIEQLGDDGRALAEHLRNWIDRSELSQVSRLLIQMEGRES
jgi:CheY-like chemotaxis protein